MARESNYTEGEHRETRKSGKDWSVMNVEDLRDFAKKQSARHGERPMTTTKIAKGRQSDWFATCSLGEELPCLKAQYLGAGGEYNEPEFYDPSLPRNVEYVDAIKQGRRVLVATYDTSHEPQKRTGYLRYVY